jgi:hypothetical protein
MSLKWAPSGRVTGAARQAVPRDVSPTENSVTIGLGRRLEYSDDKQNVLDFKVEIPD